MIGYLVRSGPYAYNYSTLSPRYSVKQRTTKGHKEDMLSDDEVLAALRLALRDLYDTPALRTNPLAGALGFAEAPNAASELRRILIETIHGLRPGGETPPEAEAWRVYEILTYRYVQQCGQAEVAKQLGLSVRHLRREELRAAEVLAHHLRARFVDEEADAPLAGALHSELAWLDQQAQPEPLDLGEVLRGALAVVQPLAMAQGATLETALPETPVRLWSYPVALRQLVLELLTTALCQAGSQPVRVRAEAHAQEAIVEISVAGLPPGWAQQARCADALTLTERLAAPCRARLELRPEETDFAAKMALPLSAPAQPQLDVLVIEDNEDTLRLLQRYVSESAFCVHGAQDLAQALQVAEHTPPHAIVLDVMMPRADGWEMLAHLRQHPLTQHAPVIVCSILAQEELALSLGASDYVRKPVSRTAFLQALERQTRRPGRESL